LFSNILRTVKPRSHKEILTSPQEKRSLPYCSNVMEAGKRFNAVYPIHTMN